MNVEYEINKELGECYLFMGEYDKAADYYKKAQAAAPEQAEPYMGLAAVALFAGDITGAHTLYAKAHQVEPNDKSLAGMAMVEVELGRHDEAFGHYAESLQGNPGNMVAVNGMLQLAHHLNRLADAVPHLEAAVSAEAGDLEAVRYALAACLTHLGREVEAKAHLEALLGANPENGEAQQLYARFAA